MRLKRVLDEWRLRQPEVLGDAGGEVLADEPVADARLLLLSSSASVRRTMRALALDMRHHLECLCPADERDIPADFSSYDLILADMSGERLDALRFCSQVRSTEASRHVPFVLIGNREQRQALFKGLDLGANEYLLRPLNGSEIAARLATQVRRHRLQQRIQSRHFASLDQAMHDARTGLYNRHYLQQHLPRLHAQAMASGRSLGLIVCDLDHFKRVNDRFGHAAGDAVAARLTGGVRTPDLVTRFGGEEFVVLLPDAEIVSACRIAERLREAVAAAPVPLPCGTVISVTASFGISTVQWDEGSVDTALNRADAGLYRAKRLGRNRIQAADNPASALMPPGEIVMPPGRVAASG